MPIKVNLNLQALSKGIQRSVDTIVSAAIDSMEKTLIQIVADARSNDTYKDQTHNLRSSIGFVLYHGDSEVARNFEARPGEGEGKDGQAGVQAAESLAVEIADQYAKQYPKAIIGVVVAGMDYAVCVEAKGYNVISGNCMRLEEQFKENLSDALEALR